LYDFCVQAGRSGLSKYNVLPSKDDILKKSDTGENINKTNDGFLSVVSNTGKENLRKIDITLTESSDRSESTSSEMHTDNLNTDRGVNGKFIVYIIISLPIIYHLELCPLALLSYL